MIISDLQRMIVEFYLYTAQSDSRSHDVIVLSALQSLCGNFSTEQH